MNDIPDADDASDAGDGLIEPAAAGAAAAIGVAAVCLSCGASVSGRYCGNCGQHDDDMRRSLPLLGRNFVEDTFAFDGRMWRTLRRLAAAPGRVPRDFAHGKRSAYTPPVRLFLWVSFLFFLVLGFTNTMFVALEVRADNSASGTKIVIDDGGEANAADVAEDCDIGVEVRFFVRPSEIRADEAAWKRCADAVSKAAHREVETDSPAGEAPTEKDVSEVDRVLTGVSAIIADPARFNGAANEWLPRIMFFMAPLLALYLAIFIRGKDALLFDHAVLAIYTHAVAFVIIGAAILLGQTRIPGVSAVAGAALFAYFLISLKSAYRRGWIKTVWTAFMVSVLYMLTLSILALALIGTQIWGVGA